MRYVAYARGGQRFAGLRHDGDIRELGPMPASFAGFRDLVHARSADPGPKVADAVPAMPVFPETRVICLGLNFAEHAREGGREPPDYPAFFVRVDTSLAPNGSVVPIPRVSTKLDYEAELLAVIGEGGRYISEGRALDHVFGYGVFNDISVRDYQRKGGQWTPGKNFDATGIIGEDIVTADTLPPGASGLRLRSILNGKVMQDDDTATMICPVAKAVSLLSDFMTLRPGDLIAMGTPSGVGYARTPPVWLEEGDEVVVEVERIGAISNRIGGRDA